MSKIATFVLILGTIVPILGCSTVTVEKHDLRISYTRVWYDVEVFKIRVDGLGEASVGHVGNEDQGAIRDAVRAATPFDRLLKK